MTLVPLVDPSIRGVEGKPGEIGRFCAAPGCSSPAQQRHHIWPRSYLRGQPYEWVSVFGRTMQNTTGLCMNDHSAVTGEIGGHRAHIRYNYTLLVLEWWAKGDDDNWFYVAPIKGQPLLEAEPEAVRIRVSENLCPECGKPKRKPHAHPPGPKRKVATWGVTVPADEEIGSDILDEWIDQLAALLGFGDAPSRLKRYHVLCVVLAWVMMNQTQLLADLEEAEFFAQEPR